MNFFLDSWQCVHRDCDLPSQNLLTSLLCGSTWSATVAGTALPSAAHILTERLSFPRPKPRHADSTAIAIVDYQRLGTGEFHVDEGQTTATISEKCREQYDLRELQRIKLQTSYDEIIDHLDALMNTNPLRGSDLVFDSTAAGIVFGDMLEARTKLDPIRITTTAGMEATKAGPRRWHVPKAELISCLSGLFSTNRVRVAHDLPNLEVLRREVQAFLMGHSSGRATYSASGSNHDDTISALSLACWWVSMKHSPAWSRRRGGEFSQGFVRGLI
jgi:hypothetical protein